ncbi:PAS domain-containing sensor histidine kinase [Paraburkholderia ultramafica]|uniref:PAS domain-containing sensor histidine kinase n=1 Tax=Paraburkholderia ultramafica TaxID=1544867 RepID=UPI00158442DD|nr:ATP-binding protein [Paraburkholderia ultramafica]
MANIPVRAGLVSVFVILLVYVLIAHMRRLENVNRAMRASEQRWRTVFENAPVGILVLRAHDRYLMANPAFQQMVGYSDRELSERRALDITHPDDRALTQKHIDQLVRGDSDRVRFQKRYLHRDGRVVWTDMSVARVFRSHQASDRDAEDMIIATVEDITQRLADEQERRSLESQLRQSQKLEALGTFAGGVAHDFNNILGAILGFGERSLATTEPDAPAHKYMEQVLKAGERARLLVERILTFSRSGLTARSPVDVRAAVHEAVDLVRVTLPDNVTVHVRVSADEAYILGDATHLHQVVMNLCSNAIHAMPGGGMLDLELDRVRFEAPPALSHGALRAGDFIRLGVADQGAGIPADILERIFNPFFTTRRAGEGTGLGLSLVDGIVREHGGAIDVHSVPGHGARFDVYLPVTDARPSVERAGAAIIQRGHGQVVLLVDDEDALVRLGEDVLAELGYEPVGFSSGDAAWEALNLNPEHFDAVVTDQTMPNMTGLELAERIAGRRPELPVILCSGFSTPELEQQARAVGVRIVLRKPLRAADLASALVSALD